jgi:hypothetical protein
MRQICGWRKKVKLRPGVAAKRGGIKIDHRVTSEVRPDHCDGVRMGQ